MRAAWLGLLLPLSALADAVLVDRVAATVDLHVITRAAVEARVRPLLGTAKTPAAQAKLRREALQQLIDERLIAEDADKQHLRIASEEIDRALEAVAKPNGLTVAQLTEEVGKQGYSLAEYRGLVGAQLLEMRWLLVKVPREAEPKDVAARAEWMAAQRTRLVDALRAAAVIEVRP